MVLRLPSILTDMLRKIRNLHVLLIYRGVAQLVRAMETAGSSPVPATNLITRGRLTSTIRQPWLLRSSGKQGV